MPKSKKPLVLQLHIGAPAEKPMMNIAITVDMSKQADIHRVAKLAQQAAVLLESEAVRGTARAIPRVARKTVPRKARARR